MSFLQYLQSRSEQTKKRITTVVIIISVLVLGSVWLSGLKSLGKEDLVPQNEQTSVQTEINHLTVESREKKGDKEYIYFRIANNTPDILNFSMISEVKLTVDNQQLLPEEITDRQGRTFVRKILSNTTAYGIMIFPAFEDSKGTLVVDNLYFENEPENLMKESMEIEFDKLQPLEELRS
ncbi:MAG TPA: hypothetical protein VEC17_01595 [Candidatus Binatia bacterium]|nr:hypothetical protein [Candidatus Binatia bacterium]